jgi:predicted transglutaminase-like cysteine proteinase
MSGRLRTALAALVCLAAPAQASSLVAAGEALPLPAWISFCKHQAPECAVDATEPEILVLTQDSQELVTAVNRYVNQMLDPVTDEDHWGVSDRWQLPTDGRGDCEDFQLLKRRLLVEAGLPRRALRMTVVIDEIGQGHAVLTIRTDRGDLILDNKTDAILSWEETGYRFVKRESSTRVGWVLLEPEPRTALVAMAR